jgi:hypothetical protein
MRKPFFVTTTALTLAAEMAVLGASHGSRGSRPVQLASAAILAASSVGIGRLDRTETGQP